MSNVDLKKMDIAYLGRVPIAHKSEGLNVLLCDTIRPLMSQGVDISIHTTYRHVSAIRQALEGNGIDMKNLKIDIYRVESILLILMGIFDSRGSKKNDLKKNGFLSSIGQWMLGVARPLILDFLNWLLDFTHLNIAYKIPVFLVLIFIALFMAIILIAVALIFIVSLLVYKFFRFFLNRIIFYLKRSPISRDFFLKLVHAYRKKREIFQQSLGGYLYAQEQIRFAKSVNGNNAVKKLFFFTAFEGHAVEKFKGSSLVVFPDIVTSLFPLRFINSHNAALLKEMRLAIKNADTIVCYSEFVRDRQLRLIFPNEVLGKTVEIIPQGYFLSQSLSQISKYEASEQLNHYRSAIANFFPELLIAAPIVDFTQFSYILYPTIDRPHKNTLTLVRAFSKVLRHKYKNIKLILTTPNPTADVKKFILDNRLHYDILFMPSVPIKVLDLLFEGAALMVHPSLAEGGDIFNFSRAAAVGTPALMADIPVVCEMFERKGISKDQYRNWIFDPIDANALAECIDEILINPSPVLASQKSIVQILSQYGFSDMANQYMKLYESI